MDNQRGMSDAENGRWQNDRMACGPVIVRRKMRSHCRVALFMGKGAAEAASIKKR